MSRLNNTFEIMDNENVKKIQTHLKGFFVFDEQPLSKQEEKRLTKLGLEVFILAKLTSAKFRRKKLPEEERNNIQRKITQFVSANKPIKITPCFGGYKQSWSEDFPGVGWAEIFHIAYMLQYVSFISTIYKPGVVLEWESEDIALQLADNFKKSDLNTYTTEFRELLKIFSANLPSNIVLQLVRSREQYDENVLYDKMKALQKEKEAELKSMSETDLKISIARASRNFIWDGEKDLTNLTEAQQQKEILTSKALNLAFLDADYELREKYFEEEVIPIVFSFGIDKENIGGWLTLASTSASFCDFWAGDGILEVRPDGKIINRVLSKNQMAKLEPKLEYIKTDFFNNKVIPEKLGVYFGNLTF